MKIQNRIPHLLTQMGLSLYAGLDKSIYILFIVRIINRFGDFVQILLVLILTGKLGMNAHEAGIFISITLIATMGGQLISGVVADKMARKYVLVFCQLMVSFWYLMCALFIGKENASLIPFFILVGSPFRGATGPITNAMVADFTNDSERGRSFSLLYLGTNIGVALGPMAAAFLYGYSLVLLFAGSSILLLISTILLIVKLPLIPSHVFRSSDDKIPEGFIHLLIKNKLLIIFLLFSSLYSFIYMQNSFALPIQFTKLFNSTLGAKRFGILMSINAITVLATTPLITRITSSNRHLINMVIAMVFFVLGYGLYAVYQNYTIFLIATFVWTIGEILMATNSNVFLNAFAPLRYRTRFNALSHTAGSLGRALGPTIGGFILVSHSFSLLWGIMASICIIIGFGYLLMDRYLER